MIWYTLMVQPNQDSSGIVILVEHRILSESEIIA